MFVLTIGIGIFRTTYDKIPKANSMSTIQMIIYDWNHQVTHIPTVHAFIPLTNYK